MASVPKFYHQMHPVITYNVPRLHATQ